MSFPYMAKVEATDPDGSIVRGVAIIEIETFKPCVLIDDGRIFAWQPEVWKVVHA